jgi:hypothetical protein
LIPIIAGGAFVTELRGGADAFAHALARHVTYRNGPHRDQRLTNLERRRQIAASPMPFPVKISETHH